MTIIDHPSPNHSERKAGVRVDTVLLHHTATATGGEALNWLRNPVSKVSAHYLIDAAGTIMRLVPENRKAWHAGKGRLPWETCAPYDFNHRSIGIEVVNPGDGVTPFTEAQYRALEWLVLDVVGRINPDRVRISPSADFIPMAAGGKPFTSAYVLGHRDVAPGRKTDPADNFDWGRVRRALAGGGA